MTRRTGKIVYQDSFDNHPVEIIDEGGYRSLFFSGNVLQSRVSLSRPHELVLFYTRYMMAATLVRPKPEHVLLIGIGAGTMVSFLNHHFPHCGVDAVDNSSRIIKLAQGFFNMPASPPVTIHCRDGFDFLKTIGPSQNYDFILVDAFNERGMSETVYTDTFFHLCMKTLRQDGVLSCNFWSGDPRKLELVKQAFADQAVSSIFIPVRNRGNIVGLAFNSPVPWEKIDRPGSELKIISKAYNFDIAEIVKIAKKTNMNSRQRLEALFLRRSLSHRQ
jgi:spermidine synthase